MESCSVESCNRPPHARSMCPSHYAKARRLDKFRPNHHHGHYNTKTYNIWRSMKQRCQNPKASNYDYYGGRGIRVCPEWGHKHTGFLSFLEDMGEAPDGMSLDRIDSNSDYGPGNCRWATPLEQGANKRRKSNTGVLGVSWIAAAGKYRVTYKSRHVCYSKSLGEAMVARLQAEENDPW